MEHGATDISQKHNNRQGNGNHLGLLVERNLSVENECEDDADLFFRYQRRRKETALEHKNPLFYSFSPIRR